MKQQKQEEELLPSIRPARLLLARATAQTPRCAAILLEDDVTKEAKWIRNDYYEGGLSISFSAFISLQPLGVEQANDHLMKAKDVPFQLIYSGLVYSKGLQNDRPKCRGMPADPRRTTVCKTVSKTSLEWCVNRRCLSSLPVTWLFLGVGCAFIPHLKEDIQGYLLI